VAPDTTERPAVRDFYADVVDNAEALVAASEIEGIDKEIALLRVKFHDHIKEYREDYTLMLQSIELLVRAVVARYRMSPRNADALAASVANVLRQVGDELFPARVTDV
jgi:hypothetical protein